MRENVSGIFDKMMERQLDEARIDRSLKNDVNRDLDRLVKNTYFNDIPIEEINDILDDYGIVLLQEDNTLFGGFFTGEEGRENMKIAPKESGDNGRYEPYKNTSLVLSWYKRGETGHYEIVTYLS